MGNFGVIGQESIIESLHGAIKQRKVGNGYLFHGPEGCGKKTLAAAFAKAINCEVENQEEKPCGRCDSCLKYDHGNHPDVEWIRPEGSSIKIRQMNQVVSDVAKKAYDKGHKIVILDHAEKMTVDAQNAFLKTLEEPPPFTVFILLAENPKALLSTVVSRCQSYRLKPIASKEIEIYLERRYPGRGEEINLATAFSNGIIGRSVQMLEDPDYFQKRKQYGEFFVRMFEGKVNLGGDYAFYNNRSEAEWFVEFALSLTRDGLILREGGAKIEETILNVDLVRILQPVSEKLTTQKLLAISDILRRTSQYLRSNVNIKGSMDAMLLNILEVTHG